jgi:hypothetical protein
MARFALASAGGADCRPAPPARRCGPVRWCDSQLVAGPSVPRGCWRHGPYARQPGGAHDDAGAVAGGDRCPAPLPAARPSQSCRFRPAFHPLRGSAACDRAGRERSSARGPFRAADAPDPRQPRLRARRVGYAPLTRGRMAAHPRSGRDAGRETARLIRPCGRQRRRASLGDAGAPWKTGCLKTRCNRAAGCQALRNAPNQPKSPGLPCTGGRRISDQGVGDGPKKRWQPGSWSAFPWRIRIPRGAGLNRQKLVQPGGRARPPSDTGRPRRTGGGGLGRDAVVEAPATELTSSLPWWRRAGARSS